MAKYLFLANNGTFDREYLEYIGHTSKRVMMDDPSIIGNKGSGAKIAAIAALRLGIELTIASSDERGDYVATYEARAIRVGGPKAMVIQYRDRNDSSRDRSTSSAFLVDAFQDWDKPVGTDPMRAFKVLREFVCNAYDEDKSWRWGFCDEVVWPPAGVTVVYLTLTDEIAAMIGGSSARYFKFVGDVKAVHVHPKLGAMYLKSELGATRLFVQGVLVERTDDDALSSAFDYSVNQKFHVTEERTLANLSVYQYWTGKLLATIEDEAIADAILDAIRRGQARFEEHVLSIMELGDAPKRKKFWADAVRRVWGEKIALASNVSQIDGDVEQIFGYKVIRGASYDLQVFLLHVDIPTAGSIKPQMSLDDIEVMPLEGFDRRSRARWRYAKDMFNENFPERADIPVSFFVPKNELTERIGEFVPGGGEEAFARVYVKADSPTTLPSVKELLVMLVHGTRHCVTKSPDYQRAFQDYADLEVVGRMLVRRGFVVSDDLSSIEWPRLPKPPPFIREK